MSPGAENTEFGVESYSAPEVTEQTLDSGGNYVSPSGESSDGELEPTNMSGEIS